MCHSATNAKHRGGNVSSPGAARPHCEAVKFATLEWVHWYNHRRLFGPLDHVPPAAFEARYYHQLHESAMAA